MKEFPTGAGAIVVTDSPYGSDVLSDSTTSECSPGVVDLTLRNLKARAEIHAIQQALGRTGWNRKQAAKLLKISYRGLLYKIRQHNITRQSDVGDHSYI
jgi:DNA-binding NtrC family response regulator